MYYKDENIIIRDINKNDATVLFTWWIDKDINKYDPRPIPSSSSELLKECKVFCDKFDNLIINKDADKNKYKYFIIESNNKQIGYINLFNFKECEAELGVVIGDSNYLRKGIAYKSLNEVLKLANKLLGLKRIYVEIVEENKPSIKLFKKIGFKRCGDYKEGKTTFIVMDKDVK